MVKGKLSNTNTLRQRCAIFFALTAVLPLLLNLFLLLQHDVELTLFATVVLGVAMMVAVLGLVFLLQTLREVTSLAKHFRKLEQGRYHTLEQHKVSEDLEEMAHIGNAFNSVLAELKAHDEVIKQLKKLHGQEVEFLDLVSDVTSEIDLGVLLQKVMAEATPCSGDICTIRDHGKRLFAVRRTG